MLTPEKFQKIGALPACQRGVLWFQLQANVGIKVLFPAGIPGKIIHGNA
jgi:hypothetical protein